MLKIVSKMTIILISMVMGLNLAFAKGLTKDQKLLDFRYLVSYIKSSYGPLEYKTKKRIVNIDRLIIKFRRKVIKTKTNGEFYYTIREFVSNFRDGHFAAIIPTTHRADLPFRTEWVDGRILVQVAAPLPGNIQLSPGDEILKMNDEPIFSVLKKLKKYVGSGSKRTEMRWAAWLVAIRPGLMLPVPSGNVKLTVKLISSGKVVNIQTKWKISGSYFDENEDFFNKIAQLPTLQNSTDAVIDFNPIENLSIDAQLKPLGETFAESNYMCSGTTRIAIPANATVIIKKPFVAYYYPTARGNVGYLRIPHYSFPDSVFANYVYAINELEKQTVALVIDQDHNCGGSVNFLGKMMGLFIDRPVENALFKLVANKSMYISLKKSLDGSNPNIIGFSIWKHFLTEVKQAWLAGEYLTPKISLQKIYPNAITRYTKPIVVLTDELSGSGGDAFPALMQGYKRAKIIGTRTSGLGGSVASIPSLPFSQIQIKLTQSLFYHPNGKEIENNGVTPDIPYTISTKDFLDGYLNYRRFYTNWVLELL